MELNVTTLMFVIGIVVAIRFLIMYYQYFINRNIEGLGWFVLWSGLDLIIFAVIILRNTLTQGEILLLPNNLLHILGLIFVCMGLLKFINIIVNLKLTIAYALFYLIFISYFAYVQNLPSVRIGLLNIFAAIILIYTGIRFSVNRPDSIRISGNIITTAITAQILVLLYIAYINLFVERDNVPFVQSHINSLQYFAVFIGGILWTFLIIVMINQRLNNDLKESMEHFRSVFFSNPDATFITRQDNNKIIDINENMCSLLGFDKVEMIGKTTKDLDVWEDFEYREEIFTSLREKKELNNLEIAIKSKDGRRKIVLASFKIIEILGTNHVLGVFRDITNRREEEEKFRLLADNMTDVVWSVSSDTNKYTYVSPSIEKVFGYRVDEIMPLYINDLQKNSEMKNLVVEILNHAERLKQGLDSFDRFFVNEIEQVRKDGSKFWTEVITNCYLNPNTGIIEIHGVTRDISKRKKAEIEKDSIYEELKRTNAEKDKFFSIIAHDLRSPFNGILGITSMMASDLSQFSVEEIQDISQNLNKSANNLYRLLNNLLDWAKIQRGMLEYSPEFFILNEPVSESIKLFSENAAQKNITITDASTENVFLIADKLMIETIIRNLLSNALKFTGTGGEVIIEAAKREGKTEIIVKDNGIGMGSGILNDLFKIDKQSSRYGTSKETGTGLGLILCREFANKHGGEIYVTSEEGKGSEFRVVLP